eukprot:5900739-Amphidinium_carterae.1
MEFYNPRPRPPKSAMGFSNASLQAKEAWAQDRIATHVWHYEPKNLIFHEDDVHFQRGRLLSPTELERCLGLP